MIIEKNRKGYLLIELMIVLVLISSMGLIIGKLKGITASYHQEASAYFKAASLASQALSGKSLHTASHIKRYESRPFANIPYVQTTVEVTLICNGKEKTFSFIGGRIDSTGRNDTL